MGYHLFIRTEDDVHYNYFENELELLDHLEEYAYDLNEYKAVNLKSINLSDFDYFSYLLISGNTIIPKPEQIVTKWEF